jgi:hypothetical protein
VDHPSCSKTISRVNRFDQVTVPVSTAAVAACRSCVARRSRITPAANPIVAATITSSAELPTNGASAADAHYNRVPPTLGCHKARYYLEGNAMVPNRGDTQEQAGQMIKHTNRRDPGG